MDMCLPSWVEEVAATIRARGGELGVAAVVEVSVLRTKLNVELYVRHDQVSHI